MLTIFRYGTLVDNETRSNNISAYSSFLIGDINKDVISNEEKDKIPMVFINIDYLGEKGEHLPKKC